jgi:AcrR family transcriptional regulator
VNLSDPAWRPPPPARPVRPRLSQDLIVRTALDIARAEGFAAVSMRRIAQALTTGAASLYAYVTDREQLSELMLDQILEDVPLPRPDPVQWMRQIKQLLRDQLRAMLAYPGAANVAWNILVPAGPNALRHSEAMLCMLRASGLDLRRAAYASDALTLYTKAFACEATTWMSDAVDRSGIAQRGTQMRQYMASLPPDTFANMLQLGNAFSAETAEERFEFALDILLRGLETLA